MAHTRITEMAAYHIGKIRSVQPQGPYLLGGMCAGGVIAFEMARQLQTQGEKVAMVALLDAADVEAPLKAWRVAGQRLQASPGCSATTESVRFDRRVRSVLAKALHKVRNLALPGPAASEELRDEIRMRLFRSYLDRGRPLPRSGADSGADGLSVRREKLPAEGPWTANWCYSGPQRRGPRRALR